MNSKERAQILFDNISRIFNRPAPKKLVSLTRGELCVLAALVSHGSMTPSDLVQITDTSSAHMAKILRNLQAKNEVVRSADLSDRRSYVMSITEKGRKHVAEVYGHAVEKTISVMKRLEEEDIEDLLRITDRLLSMKEEVVSE